MKISIEYCVQWNYKPRAVSLAAAVEKAFETSPALIEGRGGVFEIRLDDDLVFSKKGLGRFPDSEEEVIDALRAAAGW